MMQLGQFLAEGLIRSVVPVLVAGLILRSLWGVIR